MKEKGVKASEIAKETGLPSSLFTDWKKGRYTPKADKLYILAKYFGVPMEVFFEPKEYKAEVKETIPTEELAPNDFVMKLLGDKDLYVLIERIINSTDEERAKFVQMGKLMGLL